MKTKINNKQIRSSYVNYLLMVILVVVSLFVISSCSSKNHGCYDFGYEYHESDYQTNQSEHECIFEPSKASQSCVEH